MWVASLVKPHNQLVKMAGKKLSLMPKLVVKERLTGLQSWQRKLGLLNLDPVTVDQTLLQSLRQKYHY